MTSAGFDEDRSRSADGGVPDRSRLEDRLSTSSRRSAFLWGRENAECLVVEKDDRHGT
jgi:hypothetical protein